MSPSAWSVHAVILKVINGWSVQLVTGGGIAVVLGYNPTLPRILLLYSTVQNVSDINFCIIMMLIFKIRLCHNIACEN